MRVKELFDFIQERETIRDLKDSGCSKPWTKDKILQRFRFCNVYREQDTVTKWIAAHWREPHKCDIDLWFAMLVARKINFPAAMMDIGYPIPWHPDKFVAKMSARAQRGDQMEGGAYMITAGVGPKWKGVPKYRFLANAVFTPLWKEKHRIRPSGNDSLASFHGRLQEAGMTVGSFIAGQVVADLKYVRPLSGAKDWWSWAAMGPGSARGLSRVMAHHVGDKWKQDDWLRCLQELAKEIDPLVRKAKMPRLHNQDLQNCLCEFDKYERVRLGEGKPRSLYPGV
jgi:hypothetical protein